MAAPAARDELAPSEPPAVEARGVTKRFRRRTVVGGYTTFKTQLVGLISRKRREQFVKQDIEVLKGVDLVVPKGKTLGIIGQNGSGKSTMLKILTGIYTPTSGSITVRGRVSALLELGAGFHPDFSGRENIFVNGTILGLTRAQIREKVEEIIDFAELGDFIDEPVRSYSSGMYMRLAFAVATFVDPDVLIIDEILSVGDEHFSRKSRAKMEEFKERKKTIVLVTHDLGTVDSWCDLAAWIDGGRIAEFGDPKRVVAMYRQKVAEREMAKPELPANTEGVPAASPNRWGNGAVTLERVRLLNAEGAPNSVFDTEGALTLDVEFSAREPLMDVGFGIGIHNAAGERMFGTNSFIEDPGVPRPLPTKGVFRIQIDRIGLLEGNYTVDVAAHSAGGVAYDFHRFAVSFAVRTPIRDAGIYRPPHKWTFEPR